MSLPPSKPAPSWRTTLAAVVDNISDDSSHPVQIALRTYSLCLSLSLGPILLPVILAPAVHPRRLRTRARAFWRAILGQLQPTGFALAITAAVGGGAALQRLWSLLECRYTPDRPAWVHHINSLSSCQRAFLANVATSTLAITLLRWRKRLQFGTMSPTLDLSLMFLVRALDASVQALLLRKTQKTAARQIQALPHDGAASRASGLSPTPPNARLPNKQCEDPTKEWQKRVVMHLDALFFWASSARIMWCFFYQPQRLPPSYVRWIGSLANVDERLLEVLRALREGTWSYTHSSSPKRDILDTMAKELGHSSSWGDPIVLPAYGGDLANEAWKRLGVHGRSGIGGLPCELVHGGLGAKLGLQNSCVANTAIRAIYAFVEALSIYLPVHLLPVVITKPGLIMHPRHVLPALLSAIRSATFLSTFLSSYWFTVCLTRTLVIARLFPKISHDIWDGPYGCTFAGSLVCGASIWIESARRRGEMALYVLPKALRASISEKWARSRHPMVQCAECLTFIISLATLLTLSIHQPESLRGLSKWMSTFVMKGSSSGIWIKRRGEIATHPPTSPDPLIPGLADSGHRED